MQKFNVTGMSCSACSARVENAVSSLEGVTKCSVSLLTNTMNVEGNVSESEIINAVKGAGYGASTIDEDASIDEDYFKDKTIDVKGIVDCFNGRYQIKLLSINDVDIKN